VTFLGPAASTITFAEVDYTGSVNLTDYGGGIYSQDGSATGSVEGTAGGNPFSVSPTIVNMQCGIPGGAGTCGLSFRSPGFENVEGHDWVHTFNLTVALPEPTTALLVVLGLAGLALRSRSA
jgi:hypothetical protein